MTERAHDTRRTRRRAAGLPDTPAAEQHSHPSFAVAGLAGPATRAATPAVRRRPDGGAGSAAPPAVIASLRALGGRPGTARGAGGDPASDELRAAVVQRMAGSQPASRQASGPALPSGDVAEQGVAPMVRRVLRSPGKPMAGSVRTEMEAAFGADFSTVRLHDDSAARESAKSLGARAYTAGENVVLGSGTADKHTLAHELAHVVQQRSGAVAGTALGNGMRVSDPGDSFEKAAEQTAARVSAGQQAGPDTGNCAPVPAATGPAAVADSPSIQRMVGFEFETNLQVHSNGKSLIAKNAHIFESTDGSWYITPDGGTFEFVTKAFQEEGENPQLEPLLTAVGQMAEAFSVLHDMAGLAGLGQEPTPLAGTLDDYGVETPYAGHPAYVPGDIRLYPPTAVPQATGGVSLAKMTALFDSVVALQLGLKSPSNPEAVLYDGDLEERPDSYAVGVAEERAAMNRARVLAATYCKQVREELESDVDTSALEGLLLLTFTYLLAGANQRSRHDQSKYFLPLMSRMSFSAMYRSLSEEAKALLDDAEILRLAGLAGGDPLYKFGFKDPADAQTDFGPTRSDWLASIRTDQADKMSLGGASNVAQGMTASSSAMGQYGALDPGLTPEAAKLVQIELRRLPKSVPPDEWILVAETLFKMFRIVQG